MTTHTSPSKAYIPEALYDGLATLIRRTPGLSLTRLVREVLEGYLQTVEAESWRCQTADQEGFVLKEPGAPFPPRESDLNLGRPIGAPVEEEPLRAISFRLTPELHDRVYNAVWWRRDVLSHLVKAGLQRSYEHLKAKEEQR